MAKIFSNISSTSLAKTKKSGVLYKIFFYLIDRVVGLNSLNQFYLESELAGLEKQTFSIQLLKKLGVSIVGEKAILENIPEVGGCILVCNHPYGMVEGVVLAKLVNSKRKDTKIMANVGLKIFKEIEDFFIFADPLKPKSPINISAIKKSFKHVKNGGVLVIFPAGRVSFYQKDKKAIVDAEWNRIAIQIGQKVDAPILPIFISGCNSSLFHWLGRIYYRFRLLMLAREMLKLKGKNINLKTNGIINSKLLDVFETPQQKNDFVRAQCYLNDERYIKPWPDCVANNNYKKIIESINPTILEKEIEQLPCDQTLLSFKSFTVYFAYYEQIPNCVKEIARLREVTFRQLNEGSGEASDTDEFDKTYTHLFIYDHKNSEIIGAYRMGQTDRLLQSSLSSKSGLKMPNLENPDLKKLYLSQMFDFDHGFVNLTEPCLEMGRSFIIEAHQNSFHGLLLLWKGIGAFVSLHPQYRILYGTVSLSKTYTTQSVALINEVLVKNKAQDQTSKKNKKMVLPRHQFEFPLSPELIHYFASNSLNLEQLSAFITSVEPDGKDIPVLLKQYYKLNAEFHCMAIDKNFSDTPGLLLSVHLPSAPDKLLKLYLGKKKQEYLDFSGK
ncbi:MAG: hemolysin [Gammaproteobacteria bacterium]|nr:MAG: hemolysin [Gammaproteobacteria bacterium]